MTISVIIPAYNEELYLSKTLESLKKLHTQPNEIIIVDGNSTDKTVKIARTFGAKIITVKQRGIGLSRNMGLKKAACDIVAFTDADTLVNQLWLDKIVTNLSKPNVIATYGGYKVTHVDEGFFYINFINFINPIIIKTANYLGLYLGGGQNIAFLRKKGLEAGGFPSDFKSVEDFEMLRRLSKVGKVFYDDSNYVRSSGRRAYEGPKMILREIKGMIVYFLTGKADKFDFPDIR
jgi:peptidoglycan-N-acetylglucosamine deacetylase